MMEKSSGNVAHGIKSCSASALQNLEGDPPPYLHKCPTSDLIVRGTLCHVMTQVVAPFLSWLNVRNVRLTLEV